ncbi:hypothetical protein F5Y09DRAFT_323591 [Xylaria sp. FL1042]|nr:hypothetical protein F5Y09DRAFT_323591 [Xylaria sp. FL1042]
MSRDGSRKATASNMRLQITPHHLTSRDKATWESRSLHTLTRTPIRNRHGENRSELQRKYHIVLERVTGISPSSSPFPSLSSSPISSRSPTPIDDDDYLSDYGEDEEDEKEAGQIPRPRAPSSCSSPLTPDSYASLASLNPYSTNAEDIAMYSPLLCPRVEVEGELEAELEAEREKERENRDKWNLAVLEQQLDQMHADVLEEQGAALRALKQQTRLD